MHWRYYKCDRPHTRIVKKFAIFKRLCHRGHMHWLETVEVNQRWINTSYSDVDIDDNYQPWGPHSRPCICPIKES